MLLFGILLESGCVYSDDENRQISLCILLVQIDKFFP